MEGNFFTTAVGSMPFGDPDYAIDVSLKYLDVPIWPQLPKLGLKEHMEIEYSENIPCAVIDFDKSRMYFDTSGDYSDAFAEFYEQYIAVEEGDGGLDFMAITEEYSKGIYALLKRLKADGGMKSLTSASGETKSLTLADGGIRPWLKVQTVGPCSFALTIVDENKRAIYYNEEFRDVIVKALAMKCRWQIREFKPFADNIICFIDEPILSAFGSSTYVSVQRDDVVDMLSEMITAVRAEGARAGIHCCGNTEWSILIDAGVDIISFDAFGYGNTIAMYPDAVRAHLERGGLLAWGIVPTSAAILEQTVESLENRLESMMDNLASKGISKDLIVKQAALTPSCGTGSLSDDEAMLVFTTLSDLSKRMKAKYNVYRQL